MIIHAISFSDDEDISFNKIMSIADELKNLFVSPVMELHLTKAQHDKLLDRANFFPHQAKKISEICNMNVKILES